MKTKSAILEDRLIERRKKAHNALKKQRVRILGLMEGLILKHSRLLEKNSSIIFYNGSFFCGLSSGSIITANSAIYSRYNQEMDKYAKFKDDLFKTVSKENIDDMDSGRKTDPVLSFCYALKEMADNPQLYDSNFLQNYIEYKRQSLRFKFDTKPRLSELEKSCLITSEMRQAAEQLLFHDRPSSIPIKEKRDNAKVIDNTKYASLVDLIGKTKADIICGINKDLGIYARNQFDSYISLLHDIVRTLGSGFDTAFSENPKMFSYAIGIKELSRHYTGNISKPAVTNSIDLDSMLDNAGYDPSIVKGIIEGGFRVRSRGFIGSVKISFDSVKKNFKPYLGDQITDDITNTFYRLIKDGAILANSSFIYRGPYSVNPRFSAVKVPSLSIYLRTVLNERPARRA